MTKLILPVFIYVDGREKNNNLRIIGGILTRADFEWNKFYLPKIMADTGRVQKRQYAMEMLEEGIAKNKTEAAIMADITPFSFRHYMLGRKTQEEESGSRRKLLPAEENLVVERCYELGRCGFPPRIVDVKELAETIARTREKNITLGVHWIEGFYQRHKEVKYFYSKSIEYIRTARGNNVQLLNDFFDMVCEISLGECFLKLTLNNSMRRPFTSIKLRHEIRIILMRSDLSWVMPSQKRLFKLFAPPEWMENCFVIKVVNIESRLKLYDSSSILIE